MIRVLVACEYSGIVRDAFRQQGFDAWSCDILPSMYDNKFHIQDDVMNVIDTGVWDLMIAHPPCTDLAVSGAAWFKEKIADGRQQRALDFVQKLMDAPIPHIAIENPVSVISSKIRKPDQIFNPWQFGDPVSKKTCLWLKNLPYLVPTDIVEPSKYITSKSGKRYPEWCWKTGGGSGHKRSLFFEGVAKAMADQWGNYVTERRCQESRNIHRRFPVTG